ncbi:GDSL-type esterase/lipase family protein [Microbacterium sp. GXS0129]|uniref:GDSL-type esterase/lipase family protein n=1 Tax=Microbacterium sp. GXS0129 TaxID=3377836 RepID=UPI00383A78E7
MLRIHFTGDSITDAGRDRTDPASLGDGYVSLLAQAPELADARISNSGIAGNRAIDLVGRWEADVMSSQPDVLSIYVGINDVWRRFDSDDPTTDEEFEARLRHLLERVPAGVRVLLVEPFLLPVRAEQQGWLTELRGKQRVVADLAGRFGAQWVPLQQRLSEAAGEDAAAWAPDGVHPFPRASRLIADAWLDAYRRLPA